MTIFSGRDQTDYIALLILFSVSFLVFWVSKFPPGYVTRHKNIKLLLKNTGKKWFF